MSLFTELKRRNVFRVAAAYLVTGWLLIEVGNTLEETLHLPDWADSLLAFFLIIGFIPALFFTWAYEITPDGIKKERDIEVAEATRSATARKLNQLIVTVMALALVYFALDKWLFSSDTEATLSPDVTAQTELVSTRDEPAEAESAPEATKEATPSVAVLPFVNMSADADNEYFSDGISEELLNLLVRIDGLRVPSRTSSFAFKGMNTDIKDIARQLEVGHVLEGSVRKSGNKVRVTAQLIDVTTDTHLWSETYDRELEDIFVIQDEIASHIVDALQVVLGSALEQETPTQNLEAYELFLQGRYLFQQRGIGLREAERLLLQAVELDPDFAQAWGTLAMTYVVFPNYLGMDWDEYKAPSMEAAERALELDPGLAEPKLALAQAAQRDLRWVDSLNLYEAVLVEHPRNAPGHLWMGITLLQAGYLAEALAHFESAVELDPVAGINLDWLARALALNQRYEEALDPALKGVRFGRGPSAQAVLIYGVETRQYDRAFEVLAEMGPGVAFFRTALQLYLGQITPEEAQALIEATAPSELYKKYWANMSQYLLKKPEAWYATMQEIYRFDDTTIGFVWWQYSRWFRQHPLMAEHVETYRLMDVWRERGWPDLCRPTNDDDFECD